METPRFQIGTSQADAQALVMAAFQAIAGGWPTLYMKAPSLQGGPVSFDQDAMIRDAVRLAVEIQKQAVGATHDDAESLLPAMCVNCKPWINEGSLPTMIDHRGTQHIVGCGFFDAMGKERGR